MFKCLFSVILFISAPFLTTDPSEASVWTEEVLRTMSLDEKIGQLFMIAAYSNKEADYEEKLEKTLQKYHVGGILFFQGDPVRQAEMTNRYQKASKYPLWIAMDAEHGIGWRLKTAMEFPRMLINGAIIDDSLLFRLGATIGRHCKEMGVHINFAPVTDVNNNPRNPVIGMRSFGENPRNVYEKNSMYIQGMLSQGVLPVIKHFPGHGDTDTDSHRALPTISHSLGHLDSIELYPFKKLFQENIPAVMIAHLHVPALDTTGRPASLSSSIIKKFLQDSLQFQGLCFTDALNMKGVTQGRSAGEAEVEALIAGNDVLLFPENIGEAVKRIKKAIADSLITEQEIDERCRKILLAKYKYVLPNKAPIQIKGLWSRINTPEDFALKQELYKNALTLIKNTGGLLPLERPDTLQIASVNFGSERINTFQTMLSKYANITNFTCKDQLNDDQLNDLVKKLKKFNCIILYNSKASEQASRNFGYSAKLEKLITLLKGKKVILCHPGIPYGLIRYVQLPLDAILVSYEDHLYARSYAAQAIFGGTPVQGKLPVGITLLYPEGTGIQTPKIRLGYSLPESQGMSTSVLDSIDSLCLKAIRTQATPGCQVLVAKNGYILYNKAFGFHTYQQKTQNHTSNIYDIASVTKITATLPALMKLYEEKKVELDSPVSRYLPLLKETDKKDITLRELLTHTAGLKAYIPFFADAVDKEALPGRFFTTKPTPHNKLKLKDRLYANANYRFRDSTLSHSPGNDYELLQPGLYIHTSYKDSTLHRILYSELNPQKEYLYSDLGFIFLQQIIEQLTGKSLDKYCKDNFYQPLGALQTDYKAAERLQQDYIVPSTLDLLYRQREVKGYVHDPTASLLGGVAGHAGLFSTAEDLAKIMTVYLNGGTYGNTKFFEPSTVALFTQKPDIVSSNRRGLGFDKPETDSTKISPTCKEAPASSYGHTGFTGTMVWSDPEQQLIYIFLSNRTYPNEYNTKLSEENIRTKIQHILYSALQK